MPNKGQISNTGATRGSTQLRGEAVPKPWSRRLKNINGYFGGYSTRAIAQTGALSRSPNCNNDHRIWGGLFFGPK